jgi:hypothetical protein
MPILRGLSGNDEPLPAVITRTACGCRGYHAPESDPAHAMQQTPGSFSDMTVTCDPLQTERVLAVY